MKSKVPKRTRLPGTKPPQPVAVDAIESSLSKVRNTQPDPYLAHQQSAFRTPGGATTPASKKCVAYDTLDGVPNGQGTGDKIYAGSGTNALRPAGGVSNRVPGLD